MKLPNEKKCGCAGRGFQTSMWERSSVGSLSHFTFASDTGTIVLVAGEAAPVTEVLASQSQILT